MATNKRQTELRYNPQEIDKKWQARWASDHLYKVDDDNGRSKWYEMTMYPYPSGNLHIGHWYAMAPSDAHARFKRMQGYNVLHPMGFDSFGLPAENAAIRQKVHPHDWTIQNIANMKRQLRSMGTIYDWTRVLSTMDAEYYRWNQWIFLQFFKNGLAYRENAPVNWCPNDQTVLANEQVVDGKCERCDAQVERTNLEQWFFRITKFADKLLDFSKLIDWPTRIKTLQENWIGRSEGVDISFDISHLGVEETELHTFTTRIDTIHGVTFMALAPEHPLIEKIVTPDKKLAINDYIQLARQQSEIERLATDREKTGEFTGCYAINQLNGDKIPVFAADYVLLSYGTGAVMGVPAHDQRDFEFATKKNLPIKVVISPENWNGEDLPEAYLGSGLLINSGIFDGISSDEGIRLIAEHVENASFGNRTISYRLRDWLISRQRYWGTPIPIIYCSTCGTVPVPEEDLPVELPRDADFQPKGKSPLASNTKFLNTICPNCGAKAERETDTMDTFVDSSWYQLRYVSPNYDKGPFDKQLLKLWGPVDQYTGGAEHAVMHLLYTRFFTKALNELGLLNFEEPFLRLFNQGTIIADHHKMSKSRGNVIAPDPFVESLGADVVRIYLMFLGPWEQGGDWSDSGIKGMSRWVNRVWDIAHIDTGEFDKVDEATTQDLTRDTHKTIRKVITDLDRFHFNTAIAAMMEFTNKLGTIALKKNVVPAVWQKAVETLLIMLAPIAPHISEELWERLGNSYSIHSQLLPQWDEALAADKMITMIVQVNGKVRDKISVQVGISEDEAKEAALNSPNAQGFVGDKDIRQLIYVPGRLVNIVV
jgi:leucyl-tRNA synthetase